MKKFLVVLAVIFVTATAVFAGSDVLEYKSKIGFTNGEDKIAAYDFLENGRKILIIGEKNLQLWDVENSKLLNSVPHQIPQFAPRGFVSTYLLLGLPKLLSWRPFIIDEGGKWIITVEKVGTNPLRSAVVRDLQTLKQIAVMNLPDVSTEYVAYDENRNEILTFGITDKNAAFASWEDDFTVRRLVTIKEYKWHQTIHNDEKMIVGSGDSKVLWSGLNIKQGDRLTLRDIKTGAVEKEYSAQNLKPETAFQETTVSSDEEYLISKRDDRIFVWEIDGNGQPRFEISNPNPKGEFSLKEIVDRRFIVVKIDGLLRIYDVEGNGTPKFELAPQNPKEDLSFLHIINERYVLIKADNKLRVYDTQGGANRLKYEIAPQNPKDTTEWRGITKNGRFLATADDQKASVFEVAGDGKPLYEIVRQSEKERFPTVKFLEDKNLFAVARVNRSEKKEPRTEFYNLMTGKPVFDAAFEAGYGMKFTPDGKYIYQTGLSLFQLWNIADRRLLDIKLAHFRPEYDSSTPDYLKLEARNTEYVEFSPDYRYFLRYGDDVTQVYETATGNVVQSIFDTTKVKYDKQNRIKDSGLGDAGWLRNGKYVYAFEEGKFFFGTTRTVSFWEVKK